MKRLLNGVRPRRRCFEVALIVLITAAERLHAWIPDCYGRRQPNQRRLIRTAANAGDDKSDKRKPRLEDDIARRLSISKDRAISALSQPDDSVAPRGGRSMKGPAKKNAKKQTPAGETSSREKASNSLLPPPLGMLRENSSRGTSKRKTVSNDNTLRPPSKKGSKKRGKPRQNAKGNAASSPQYSSLLPPLLTDVLDESEDVDDPLSSGLASWEDFLEMGTDFTNSKGASFLPASANATDKVEPTPLLGSSDSDSEAIQQKLPSIQDLFPPDLSSAAAAASASSTREPRRTKSQPLLDGVLPVSDLFYRSSQSQFDHDDEELPFSAEQSDAVVSDDNSVRIRRNLAQRASQREQSQSTTKRGSASRRMVRRGMEMLVGGVPINADPPHRSLELFYDPSADDWAAAISLNTEDFGPLLHTASAPEVSEMERGLLAERFCHYALKWDICPDDLKQIVASYTSGTDSATLSQQSLPDTDSESTKGPTRTEREPVGTDIGSTAPSKTTSEVVSRKVGDQPSTTSDDVATPQSQGIMNKGGQKVELGAEFAFEIGVSREDLESGVDGRDESILRDVIAKAFKTLYDAAVVRNPETGSGDYSVEIERLILSESDDGFTHVHTDFKLESGTTSKYDEMERRMGILNEAVWGALNEGDFALALASAAREEQRWPSAVRASVEEECLFQDDDYDEPVEGFVPPSESSKSEGLSRDTDLYQDEDSVVSGDDTSFSLSCDGFSPEDFAKSVADSPYGGKIGPRLLDAIVEKAKERRPRVIAVGDVHGCIDELQDLLRQCDYRPGDLVVFLGDLVCKGPDSISVVQMAREIGAIGIRGNHDFEVIRWHQAIKSGVDPPVVGSEHFHIASCLTKADMHWLNSLPWYISSKELSTLFVHAGFVSGIRLAKQNPRLMMNMRSILPDGTVTSKFFNNWPWARLWDGPQTVLFGHDADRGLQQYEHAIGLDTGCVYGGRLTALVLPEKKLVSVSARREYFKYRRKHYD